MRFRTPVWPSLIFLMVVVAIGVYAIVGYQNLKALAGDYAWVTRSHDVLHGTDAVLVAVLESENAARGFALTGDETNVTRFETAARRARERLSRLEALTRDDPTLRQRMTQLQKLVEEKYRVMRDLLRARREEGLEVAPPGPMQGQDPELMERIEGVISDMRAAEQWLLSRRAGVSRSTHEITLRAGAVMSVLALFFLTVSYLLFSRALAVQMHAAEALESRKVELEEVARQRTAELQAFAHELERSNRDLEQFAFVASHDLREPLRKIHMFADRLGMRPGVELGDDGRDYLDRIAKAATRMTGLIDDLLALSRINTKGQPFTQVDLGTVVRGVVEDLEARIEQSHGRVEVGPLPAIEADPLQMRQLFQNLIDNGLKFHRPEVPPVVRIEADMPDPAATSPSSEDQKTCRITVRDNGIGFDSAHSEKIFEVFQRLHGRTEFEGSGMGLAICRRIAERHGGRISAHGQPGLGASFVVVLPVARPGERSDVVA